jgi:hypothetical protein
MNKLFLEVIVYIFLSLSYFQLVAQYNLTTIYSNHNDLNASRYEPSELILEKKFQIGGNYYFWLGNTFLDYSTVSQFFNASTLTQDAITRVIQKAKNKNILGIGQDWQVIGFAFQLANKLDFSFCINEKFGMSFQIPKNLLKLALEGNKQFAGEQVSLGPTRLNANYWREFVLGSAFNLFGDPADEELAIRGGIRAKYITGLGAIFMPKGEVDMFTEAQGRYIDMNIDYEVNTAGISKGQFGFFKSHGSGFGIDLGLTAFVSDRLEFNLSLIDVGTITYNKNVTNYKKSETLRYDGVLIEDLFGSRSINTDSIRTFFQVKPGTTGEKFNMPLGSKLILQAEYKTNNDKDGDKYVDNAIYLTYVQGLNNMPGATTRPYFSVAYNHDFSKIFDLGISLGLGGYNIATAGMYFSLNLGNSVKFGLGSDNLLPLVAKKAGTGIDVSANMTLSFGEKNTE